MSFAVPIAPGVPGVYGGSSLISPYLGSLIDISALLPVSLSPMWGIFLNGAPVVTADSVISMDARQEAVVADYQIEQGSFETYDKVIRPFDVRFRFASGGNDANRAALFASVKALFADKTNFYMFISPEDIFENVTISHYDYHRTSINGVGLPAIDVWGWQLLVGSSTTSSGNVTGGAQSGITGGTQSIAASPQINNGSVQGITLPNSGYPALSGSSYSDLIGSAPLLSGGIGYPALSQ